jgi:hypothetical protein
MIRGSLPSFGLRTGKPASAQLLQPAAIGVMKVLMSHGALFANPTVDAPASGFARLSDVAFSGLVLLLRLSRP